MRIIYEIKTSQYDHPEKTSGQHTNGPANIFVRGGSQDSPWWVVVEKMSLHKVRTLIEELGLVKFKAIYCEPVDPFN